MIELLQKNYSFVLICITMLVCPFLPLRDWLNHTDENKYKVPAFQLPAELKIVTQGVPTQFSTLNKTVLLGEQENSKKEVIAVVGHSQQSTRPLRVKAIMIDGNERIANINGEMYKVGGHVSGNKILSIQDNGVVLAGPDGKQLIKMLD